MYSFRKSLLKQFLALAVLFLIPVSASAQKHKIETRKVLKDSIVVLLQKLDSMQKAYDEMQAAMNGTLSVIYPIPGGAGDYCTGAVCIACKANKDGSVNFQSQGEQIGEEEYPAGSGKMVPVFKYYDHVAR